MMNKSLLKILSLSNQDFNQMSSNQIFWLANLPVNVLGELKFEIYDKLISESFKMFIPIDFLKQYEYLECLAYLKIRYIQYIV